MFRTIYVAFVLMCLLAIQVPVEAQILYGSIVGNVKDPSDAAIAGAKITITNKQTNQVRESETNETGAYSFPTLSPGPYSLRVAKEGFRTATEAEVLVTINSVTRSDLSLQLGSVTETVQVEATSASLQTDRSEVRSEITSQTFQNLPVQPGRNYQQLFKTLPGFRPPSNAHSVPTNPSRALTFNVNGASQSINNTRIDGASSIAPWLPHATAFVPTLESIETVNVVTNSFDAEQGLAGGAAINVQIKGGTNDLHGALFEYHTNNNLKSKNFFLPAGQSNPKLVVNEFGGVLGGPIKKNKLFYFMSYESNLNREFASRFGTVPTAAMKRGDLSESPRIVYDPTTGNFDGSGRLAFANNTIPLSRFSSITKKLVDVTPDPNQPGLSNNYFAAASYAFDRHRADTKVNYNHSDKFTTFGRFSILHYDMNNPTMFGQVGGPEISSAGGNPGLGTGRTYSFTGAATYILRPNLILDAYYGYTRMDTAVEQPRLGEKLGLDFLGIPGTNGTRSFEGGWPQFDVNGFTSLGISNAFMPYYRKDPQYQYVANFNWTKQAHEVRFGMDLYRTGMNHTQPEATGALFGAQGGFGFGGGPTNTTGQAANNFNNYGTFLLGLPTTKGKITMVPDEYNTRSFQYSFYVRDRWNVSRKLTASYGVRWEYFPFPTRADRGLELYDSTTNRMLICGAGNTPRDCGVSESKRKFAPRVGIAYRATDTFVIRAGYGLTNDPFSLQRPFRTNYPVLLIQNIESENSFQNTGNISTGIPQAVVPDISSGLVTIPGTFAVVTADKNFTRGYVQSWNLTLQKQLKWGFVAQAGYVATRSTNQMGYLDANAGQVIGANQNGRPLRQSFGRTAATTVIKPLGTTTYDSLQATLERRMAQGVGLNIAYTFSKVIGYIDNNDSEPAVRAVPYFDRNRTIRSYDRPHNIQISNIIELPFGKGKKYLSSGGAASWLASGWQFNNILSFYSGVPFSVTADGASLAMPGSQQTADQIKPAVAILGGVGKGTPFFDVDAFAPVTAARFGNTAMNLLRGPGVANWDLGMFRRFNVTERFRLEFRAEAFNITNTPHFNNPGTNVSSYTPALTDPLRRYNGFGEITGTSGIGRDGIDERQFRLGLRLSF